MAHHRKKKSGYQGCRLCKPHKAQGNSQQAIKPKYRDYETKRRQVELESN